jgi:flagellar biosynthesis GTPase FlhF
VRWFGTGQEVPADLAAADPALVVDRLLPASAEARLQTADR